MEKDKHIYYRDLPLIQKIGINIHTFVCTVRMLWGFIATIIGCYFLGHFTNDLRSPIMYVFAYVVISYVILNSSKYHAISLRQAYLFNQHIRKEATYDHCL